MFCSNHIRVICLIAKLKTEKWIFKTFCTEVKAPPHPPSPFFPNATPEISKACKSLLFPNYQVLTAKKLHNFSKSFCGEVYCVVEVPLPYESCFPQIHWTTNPISYPWIYHWFPAKALRGETLCPWADPGLRMCDAQTLTSTVPSLRRTKSNFWRHFFLKSACF